MAFCVFEDEQKRERFMAGITQIIHDADFTIIAAVLDKRRLPHRFVPPSEVHELVLGACIGGLHYFLMARGEGDRMTHIVIESRGKSGDSELDIAFQRVQYGKNAGDEAKTGLEIIFADKKTNSIGLQIADLIARPIGLRFINPEQSNRAWNAVEPKLLRSPQGHING